ncbi:hypothetical protein VTN96DRAFT_6806 [Rasamsonia emersonii]
MNVPSPATFGISGWGFGYESSNVTQAFLELLSGTGTLPQYAAGGTIISGGGSGANAPPYISAPFDAILEQAHKDNTGLFWDFDSVSPNVDAESSACLVFINAFSAEGFDRVGLHDDYSDALVLNIASKCNNTIVIIHNAGIRLVDQWIDHPNVTAVMFAHLPGQESGRALVQLLYGYKSPSGKLPYTVARNESDYNVLSPALPEGRYSVFPQSIVPRYEFGFGLSYTTFEYDDLRLSLYPNASTSYYPPNSTVLPGGLASLWDVILRAEAMVKNTGQMAAAEVSQLYVAFPGDSTAVKQLRGFAKTFMNPGESKQIRFALTRRDLSRWSAVDQAWVLQRGTYEVYVGASSRDLSLSGRVVIP